MINLFGGYPGLLEYKSSLHASHGFASLALAYVGIDSLPSTVFAKLDLEYFEKAVQYLKNHPNVQGDNGIGVYGICKGAQIAFMMATHLQDIRCVVAINGNCVVSCGTMRYKDQNFDFDAVEYDKIVPGQHNDLATKFGLSQAEAVDSIPGFIPFHKKHDVSYMIVAGLADTCMPTRYMVGEMERLLQEENHPDFEVIKYTDAGHLIEPPNVPFRDSFYQTGPKMNAYLTTGGLLKSHCKSQDDSWPKKLNFLKQRLLVSNSKIDV